MAEKNVNAKVEKIDVVAKVNESTDIVNRKEYAVINGFETFITDDMPNAKERKKNVETGIKGVMEALALGRKSALRLSKALYFIKSKEIYKDMPRKNDKARSYSSFVDFVGDYFAIGKTLANNSVLAYEKFFLCADNKEEGILVAGRPAIEYSQTALIELLPVIDNDAEKTAVYAEISPLSPIKDIKASLDKHHEKKATNGAKKAKKAETKALACDDILRAVLDLLKGFATADGIEAYTPDMLASLDKAKIEINGILARRENA